MDKDILAYQRYMASQGSGYTPSYLKLLQQPKQQAPKKKSTGLGSFIGGTVGSVGGGLLGSLIAPGAGTLGGGIAGGSAGSAIGEALDQLLTGGKVQDGGAVGREALLGAVPGVLGGVGKSIKAARATKGATRLAETIAAGTAKKSLLQKGATRASDALAIKGLKLNPSQLTKYAKVTGEDVTKTLGRHGLQGADSATIAAKAAELQDAFDGIAKSTKIAVPRATLQSRINEALTPLKNSTLGEQKALAQQIDTEMKDVLRKVGSGKATLADLTELRKTYDKATKSFAGDPVLSTKNRAIGTILRQTIQDVADKAGLKTAAGTGLKETGQELKRLYSLSELVGKQDNLGRGALPIGLTGLLGMGIGGPAGGVGGAAAGYAATKVLNSRPVSRAASRGLAAIGENGMPGAGLAGQLARAGIGQGVTRAVAGGSQQEQPVDTQMMPNITSLDNTSMTTGTDTASAANSLGVSKEFLQQLAMADVMQTGGKNLAEISKLAALFPDTTTTKKPLSAEANKQVANATSGLQALQDLRMMLSQDPNLPMKNLAPGAIGKGLTGSGTYETARQEIIDVLARLRTGAAITATEEARFRKQLPQVGDNADTVAYKLDMYEQLFSRILGQSQAGSPDLETLQ